MSDGPRIAVVGGGIAGLAAAHALAQSQACVTLIEADERLGGKVRSEQLAGETLDVGPESLMTRAPAAVQLCRELDLEDELVAPLAISTSVWARGRLRELPPGILGGLPQGPRSVLRSGILSPRGVARASLDLVLPASRANGDRAVSELVGRRLGRQALERLVDPLLGTIYAAGCDTLSLRATAPQLEAIAAEHRSLIRGLGAARRANAHGGPRTAPTPGGPRPPKAHGEPQPANAPGGPRPATGPGGPLFVTLPGGLEQIVARLAGRIGEDCIRTGTRVRLLTHAPGGGYRLMLSGGESLSADGVVIATPARQSAQMLAGLAPFAAGELRAIDYVSAVVVTLRYPSSAMAKPPAQAGFLVPEGERGLLGACTWLSSKWPHLAASGELWLRCSVARRHVADALRRDDPEIVSALCAELGQIAGLSGAPLDSHVTRWENALPHYRPGHLERVARIERHMENLQGVALAGSAYRGMGVPQCIAQGQAAAEQVLAAVASSPQREPLSL